VWRFPRRVLPFAPAKKESQRMNSNHTSNDNEPNSIADLDRLLNSMEKAGASWEDRASIAINYLEAQQEERSAPKPLRSEPTSEDEELTFDNDPITSEHDASGPDPEASTSEPEAHTSEPDASQSEQETATPSDPDADPSLPPPPKFQFGPNNPLYELALDFRAYRDKRSILDRLTDAQRQAIAELLHHYTEDEVSQLLAKAPPAGLSIRVSRASLNRFRHRYDKQQRRRNSNNFKIETLRCLDAANGNDQVFLTVSERLLKMRLLETTGDPNANLETISKLTNVITTLRKQSLVERRAKPNPETTEPPAENQCADPKSTRPRDNNTGDLP